MITWLGPECSGCGRVICICLKKKISFQEHCECVAGSGVVCRNCSNWFGGK